MKEGLFIRGCWNFYLEPVQIALLSQKEKPRHYASNLLWWGGRVKNLVNPDSDHPRPAKTTYNWQHLMVSGAQKVFRNQPGILRDMQP